MSHLLEHILLWFSSMEQQSSLPRHCLWARQRNQTSWILAEKFYQDMCHHEVRIKHVKERNIYSDELYITVALLSYTQ